MKRNGASNSNGSNNSMGDGKEDEELAYLMEDIMPRIRCLKFWETF